MDNLGIYDVTILGYDIRVEVTYYTPEVLAFTAGAPEDCYPYELEEIEWEFPESVDALTAELILRDRSLEGSITNQLLENINDKD